MTIHIEAQDLVPGDEYVIDYERRRVENVGLFSETHCYIEQSFPEDETIPLSTILLPKQFCFAVLNR